MDAWVIILIVVAVLALLAVGGNLAQRRRMEATAGRFSANLDRVNNDLAAAHAADRGWDPERLQAAARQALQQHGDGAAGALTLVAVVDPPGTDDDKAVFEVEGTSRRLTLGRRGHDWVFEHLS
jgi:FtsZ-interacting cell division protein ZipA